jgi:hypothetical protein
MYVIEIMCVCTYVCTHEAVSFLLLTYESPFSFFLDLEINQWIFRKYKSS